MNEDPNFMKSWMSSTTYLRPYRWDIKIKQINDLLWEMHYTESLRCKDKELLNRIIKNTQQIADMFGAKMLVKNNKLSLHMRMPFDVIANAIVGEFFAASKLADLTLRDIFLLSTLSKKKRMKNKIKEWTR